MAPPPSLPAYYVEACRVANKRRRCRIGDGGCAAAVISSQQLLTQCDEELAAAIAVVEDARAVLHDAGRDDPVTDSKKTETITTAGYCNTDHLVFQSAAAAATASATDGSSNNNDGNGAPSLSSTAACAPPDTYATDRILEYQREAKIRLRSEKAESRRSEEPQKKRRSSSSVAAAAAATPSKGSTPAAAATPTAPRTVGNNNSSTSSDDAEGRIHAPPESPPHTGYLCFVAQMTMKLRHDSYFRSKDNEGDSNDSSEETDNHTLLTEQVSERWNALTPTEKQNYTMFAASARDEYKAQEEEYKVRGSYRPSSIFEKVSGTNLWFRKRRQDQNELEREISDYDTYSFPPLPPPPASP